jgi:monoamine oxidase
VKVIVVGAGLSGLVSGMQLQEAGHEVVMLEARERVGGRVLTAREGFEEGQYADVGAMILYEGQPNILELCERFGLELTPAVTFGAELPALLFGERLLDPDAVGAAFQELGETHEQKPPVPFETLAAWVRRTKLSSTPHAFLEALIQIQPSIPLRYVDAHALHLGPEVFMQISGGNDQLPRRIAEGLDVRLGQPVRTIGWSDSGVTVETEAETLSADLVVIAVPGPLTTELGWDPPLPPEKVGALVSLRYGTGAGVGIQYAETDVVREAIQTGIFTDRLPNWFLDVSAHQSGQPIVVVTILSAERQPRGLDEAAVLEEADRTMAMVTGSPVTRVHGTVVSWTEDPYSRCIARAPIGDQRETLLPLIRAPLGRSVFFAGEHTDDRPGPGGMEGAIKSGYRVAVEILDAMK